MSTTIKIQDDLFCEMIFSLLDEVTTKQQVDWLYKYGANFYDLKLFEFIEKRHAISDVDYDKMTSDFWSGGVQYMDYTWDSLLKSIGTDLYQNYVGFSFDDRETVADIKYTMEGFGADKAKNYYSPVLLRSIAANHGLVDNDVFSFTKAMTSNNDVCIVFKIKSAGQEYFYDILTDPT